jgi:hypothetical protein
VWVLKVSVKNLLKKSRTALTDDAASAAAIIAAVTHIKSRLTVSFFGAPPLASRFIFRSNCGENR